MVTGNATFTPMASDFIDASRTRFVHSIRQPRFVIRLATLVGVTIVFVAGASVALGMGIGEAASSSAMGAGGGLLVLLIIIVGTYLLIPRRATRTFRQQKSAHHEMTVMWTSDGLILRTRYGETEYPWSDLHGWIDGRNLVLILASENVAYFIPKRALNGLLLQDLTATLSMGGLPHR